MISCPREHMITVEHAPEEGPGTITINQMPDSDLYSPVVFSHRSHAEMSGMAGGCSMCHHYNPPGRVVPCRDCHEVQ
ncbi:MAG: cytochrome c3 family protein, partial [Saprospiraceae bacterium]|nr:cytochrome c3 family protein [Saprospiraceae bacterium]